MNLCPSNLLCQRINFLLNLKRTKFMDRKQRRFFELNDREESDYFSANDPNPVADIEKKIEESKARLKWRNPIKPQEGSLWGSGLRFLAPERTKPFFEMFRRPLDHTSLKASIRNKVQEVRAVDQRFNPDRHRILGNDLATAHFVIARGGQVRFTRSKEWVTKNKFDEIELPRAYKPEYLIDAIKCEGMDLIYEGLENFRRLNYLIYLSFRNLDEFDDWYLDRVCGEQFERLKILDISGTKVTANGLFAVPKLPTLDAIVLDKSNRSTEFQLACSLLQEVMPHLKILDSADVHDDVLMTKHEEDSSKNV